MTEALAAELGKENEKPTSGDSHDFSQDPQKEVMERVMNATDNLAILGMQPNPGNSTDIANANANTFLKKAAMLHPKGNKHPEAETVFERK